MGGDLSSINKNSGPSFAIKVVKDPIGANLDRVQIVKGWIDRDGKSREKIYDVAWSDDRDFDSSGQLEPVGNTVDLTNGMHENTIGETDFFTIWQDPDFNRDEPSFYYIRALEIPTARHSLLDALALESDDNKMKPYTIQERAYTSPIWYNPQKIDNESLDSKGNSGADHSIRFHWFSLVMRGRSQKSRRLQSF